jgi:MOSC domain-containing protein YiiM
MVDRSRVADVTSPRLQHVHPSYAELEALLPHLQAAPREIGTLDLIVCRPQSGQREVLEHAMLDPALGLVGDRWGAAAAPRRRENQVTLMGSRVAQAVARTRERWPLAGDQLYVDFDLGVDNVPPGTRLAVGEAVLEVSAEPHLPCRKFRDRYGVEAVRFLGSPTGKVMQMRGINAWVVVGGRVRCGDAIRKLA